MDGSDLVPYGEVIEGELITDPCRTCGRQGEWVIDPYDQDVLGVETMVCLCPECYEAAEADI